MTDRNFCPPSSANEFRDSNINHPYGQREQMLPGRYTNGFNGHDSSAGMHVQNGHFQTSPIFQTPSLNENSPTKTPQQSIYQHGNTNFNSPQHPQQSTYANIAASKHPQQNTFDPFGYRSQPRTASYNINQQPQRIPNFIPDSRQQPHFLEEQQTSQQSAPFSTFSALPPNSSAAAPFVPRSSQHQSFLPSVAGIPPSFQPSGENPTSFQQQNFISGIQQTTSNFNQNLAPQLNTNTSGSNFDMAPIPFGTGINNQNGNCNAGSQHQMVNGIVGADEFGPDFVGAAEIGISMPAQYVLSNELLARIENTTKKQALLEFQIGLEQIAFDTSINFNIWATVIKDRMIGKDPLSEADLRIAAEIIVEMAVVLDESQYNFSRLCQFLGAGIDNFNQNVLLNQVNSFVTETNTFLSSRHLLNLTTFLAELYDKIEIKGVKSSQLAAHLFDQLHNVLKLTNIDDQSIGVIVKVLKLVGRFLENDRGPQALDEFILDLEAASKNTSDASREKVKNLISLRSKQWGIIPETPVTSTPSQFPSVGILGPDGEQLTEDECNFLDENFDALGNSPSGSLYNNPMEEDNVEDDYEQFLQATAIQAAEKALEKVSIDEDDESIISSSKYPGAYSEHLQ